MTLFPEVPQNPTTGGLNKAKTEIILDADENINFKLGHFKSIMYDLTVQLLSISENNFISN